MNTNYTVSVPLRGKGRDQIATMYSTQSGTSWRFPSPCGEKVGIKCFSKKHRTNGGEYVFPSPCGEKVGIKQYYWNHAERKWKRVSVPLRGKGRDQSTRHFRWLYRQLVSVPLRGKGRDQTIQPKDTFGLRLLFPSPCGEKVGIKPTPGKA